MGRARSARTAAGGRAGARGGVAARPARGRVALAAARWLTCGGRTLEFWRVMLLSMAATRWILMMSVSMYLGRGRGRGG